MGARPKPSELRSRGREVRQRVPRSSHAGFQPAPDRTDPLETLAQQDTARVPELVPIRYGRMGASPFAFFRGQAAVMAADLAATPTTGITAQLCGDAHLANFGTFATPERRIVYDINDFDETLPGPFDWDLKRLSASLVIAARHRGFDDEAGSDAVRSATRTYRTKMQQLADADVLDVWYESVADQDILEGLEDRVTEGALDTKDAAAARKLFDRAQRRTSQQAARKLTEVVDGEVRFREEPPILSRAAMPADRLERVSRYLEAYRESLPAYRHQVLSRFEVIDTARRVVGVGSVGTRAYVVLLHGRDADDPLVLQVKEAGPSVLEEHLGANPHPPAGRRVVEGQRLMQSASDLFLGWLSTTGLDGQERDYYVRQFRDMKGSVDLERISPDRLVAYASLCGNLLAAAHARSGEPAEITGYLGSGGRFEESLVAFSHDYADVNETDHARLIEAIADGRIDAQDGV